MNHKFQPHKAHVPYLLQLLVSFSRLIGCFLRQSFSGLLMMIGYLRPYASHRLRLRLGYAFVWWFQCSQTSQILPSSQWLDCCWLDVFKFDCVLPHLIGYGFTFFTRLFWDLCGAHRCVRVEAREATNEELSSVHTQNHVELLKAVSSKSYGKHQLKALACCYDSIFFNNSFSKLALLAVGSVIEVVIHPCVFLFVGHCFSHLLRLFSVTQSWKLGILLWK